MFETSESTVSEPRSSQEPILEVRDANVTFRMGRGQARVMDDINIDIYRGETLGIVGESGCGKSVFASSLLNAVEDPGQLSGEITYYPENGEPVDLLELGTSDLKRIRWREIATVFQGAMSSFNPTKPIKSHFEETLEAHNEDKEEGMERTRGIMRDLNLDPERILETYQHELSGGQRQRVLLALSLLLEPDVIVLDEPTAALDLLMQRTILRLLHEIKDEYDLTLVFITHDLPVIAGFADRLGVMYAFDFVELGETEDVMRNGAHPYTRALIQSTPTLDMAIEDIQTVDGSSPDPINIPSGCSYHPRCPISDDRCEIEEPELLTFEEDQQVACFYPEKAKREIEIPLSGGESR
ncbi:ABC transporter ATP-binding protein [Halomontanus rarus]|uniref:ABC transporter ATP-binding protein n=1 Tax=Halomontanus rarus TaxID=3034020 RepID=UPI0023E8F337|nr:ABC transporter ATP-binding protein [Halovivax sp. TS33]